MYNLPLLYLEEKELYKEKTRKNLEDCILRTYWCVLPRCLLIILSVAAVRWDYVFERNGALFSSHHVVRLCSSCGEKYVADFIEPAVCSLQLPHRPNLMSSITPYVVLSLLKTCQQAGLP